MSCRPDAFGRAVADCLRPIIVAPMDISRAARASLMASRQRRVVAGSAIVVST
jgi:hypothetical protein